MSALGQDAAKVAPNQCKVRTENKDVRVIEFTLAPGEKDKVHTHPAGWYYVTKPGTMKILNLDTGKTVMWEAKEGEAGWMEAEAPHLSENVGTSPVGFILVEVKSAAKAAEKKPKG